MPPRLLRLLPAGPRPRIVIALALGMAGCASIPPDRNPLPQQDMARVQLARDIRLARDGWPDAQWWRQYRDPQLDRLIERALAHSPTLAVAAARIAAAHSALALNAADSGLNVGFDAASNRQRYSANGLFPTPIGGNYFSETTLAVQARYQFDWWGKRRATIAAALGEVDARRADYAQAEQTLTAAIAQSYFNLQSDFARLANLRRRIAAQRELVADRRARVRHGLASSDERRLAESGLDELNRQLASLEARRAGEREALRALLGADAGALTELEPRPIAEVSQALPAKLGMELLARRPDLQAARWRIVAALSRVEAARASFYPDINLLGAFGTDALSFDHLLAASSRTPFVGSTLSLPLFDSRRLDARLESTRSERNLLIADYNRRVIDAVRDIARQAIALRGIEAEIAQQRAADAASDDLLHSAQARFKQGLADRGAVLSAESARLRQQDALLQLENQRLLAEVALDLALGGGYRTDSPSGRASHSSKRTNEAKP